MFILQQNVSKYLLSVDSCLINNNELIKLISELSKFNSAVSKYDINEVFKNIKFNLIDGAYMDYNMLFHLLVLLKTKCRFIKDELETCDQSLKESLNAQRKIIDNLIKRIDKTVYKKFEELNKEKYSDLFDKIFISQERELKPELASIKEVNVNSYELKTDIADNIPIGIFKSYYDEFNITDFKLDNFKKENLLSFKFVKVMDNFELLVKDFHSMTKTEHYSYIALFTLIVLLIWVLLLKNVSFDNIKDIYRTSRLNDKAIQSIMTLMALIMVSIVIMYFGYLKTLHGRYMIYNNSNNNLYKKLFEAIFYDGIEIICDDLYDNKDTIKMNELLNRTLTNIFFDVASVNDIQGHIKLIKDRFNIMKAYNEFAKWIDTDVKYDNASNSDDILRFIGAIHRSFHLMDTCFDNNESIDKWKEICNQDFNEKMDINFTNKLFIDKWDAICNQDLSQKSLQLDYVTKALYLTGHLPRDISEHEKQVVDNLKNYMNMAISDLEELNRLLMIKNSLSQFQSVLSRLLSNQFDENNFSDKACDFMFEFNIHTGLPRVKDVDANKIYSMFDELHGDKIERFEYNNVKEDFVFALINKNMNATEFFKQMDNLHINTLIDTNTMMEYKDTIEFIVANRYILEDYYNALMKPKDPKNANLLNRISQRNDTWKIVVNTIQKSDLTEVAKNKLINAKDFILSMLYEKYLKKNDINIEKYIKEFFISYFRGIIDGLLNEYSVESKWMEVDCKIRAQDLEPLVLKESKCANIDVFKRCGVAYRKQVYIQVKSLMDIKGVAL